MKHPDPYTRCIKMDGTIDLGRLKRLSRELQEDYERVHFSKTILEEALRDIADRVGTLERETGKVRESEWVTMMAAFAIQQANKYETAALDEAAASQTQANR